MFAIFYLYKDEVYKFYLYKIKVIKVSIVIFILDENPGTRVLYSNFQEGKDLLSLVHHLL